MMTANICTQCGSTLAGSKCEYCGTNFTIDKHVAYSNPTDNEKPSGIYIRGGIGNAVLAKFD